MSNPLSPAEEASLRASLAQRHPVAPGVTAEGARRILDTLDRDRKFIPRAASAMREVAMSLSDDDRALCTLLMGVDLDALVSQARDPGQIMDTDELARAARVAVERKMKR